jgi:formate dehydrogenase subunit beta
LEMSNYRLEVKDGVLETMTAFLRGLLEQGIVDALLVPRRTPAGDNVVQTLFADPTKLENIDPIAPVLPVNSAKLVSDLTKTGTVGRLGAVLRSCEVRALIELVKLKQASLDNVLLIGVDCLGTYEMNDYAELAASGNGDLSIELLAQAKEGHIAPAAGYQFRVACQMCEYPIPQGVDLALGLIGVDTGKEILVTASDELAEKLGLSLAEVPTARQAAVNELVAERTAERDRRFAEFRQRVTDMTGPVGRVLYAVSAATTAWWPAPSATARSASSAQPPSTMSPPRNTNSWANRKGSRCRIPTDTLLFHITRLNHMVTSCVGCGMCESACPTTCLWPPSSAPSGQKVQALFDYVPGRSLEEELPVATFREDELTSLGGRG